MKLKPKRGNGGNYNFLGELSATIQTVLASISIPPLKAKVELMRTGINYTRLRLRSIFNCSHKKICLTQSVDRDGNSENNPSGKSICAF